MTLNEILSSYEDSAIIERMVDIYPEWFIDDKLDIMADFQKLLTLLRRKTVLDCDIFDYENEHLFLIQFENHWCRTDDTGYKPYLNEVFIHDLKRKYQNIPTSF